MNHKLKLALSVAVGLFSASSTASMAQDKCVPFNSVMKKYNVTEKNELFSFCGEGIRYSYFKLNKPLKGKKYLLLIAGGSSPKQVCAQHEELISDEEYKQEKAVFKAGTNDEGVSSLKEVCWN